ncbi:hypothetical protein Vadar_017444 [Vaccinium darrowii]|uniref:Uncharacterized protein n=1 Tax=Vaccinium darrowii TaxID=229202 RepID=A0ACB7XAG9_9ERIC|nr:hypothetical protein Vadar_017444 [Vaccinium darrowii]
MTLDLTSLLATFFFSTLLILALRYHFGKTKPPLHHPPTPFSLPIVGHLHLLSPLIHCSLDRLSSIHGPLIRLRLGSVPCIVFSTPQYAKEFLKTHDLNFSTRKNSTAINRLTYNSSFAFAPYGPYWKKWDVQGFGKRCEDIFRRYDALLEKRITSREEMRKENGDGGSAKDFLDILVDVLEDEDSEVKLTRDHIKALILDFFTAATDTSAIALEWALAELINNPKVLKRAQEEIDTIVGKHRLVAESDGPNLPYIQAIVKETLRLHPPIPMVTRRSVQECIIDGYNIPAHTMLIVNIWSIGRNAKYWENPLDFWPERFLRAENDDPVGLIDVKGQHFQLLSFGTGRRGCPGMSLALQQLQTVLAATIQCFDWKVVDPRGGNIIRVVDMIERPGLTVPRAHDLVCMPVPRIDLLDSLLDP